MMSWLNPRTNRSEIVDRGQAQQTVRMSHRETHVPVSQASDAAAPTVTGDFKDLKRWLVLGPGGAGKTTFGLALSRLKLPLIHLDRHYWRPGWVPSSKEVWERKVVELAGSASWVMDGNYSGTLALRLRRAEVAVLLDPPTIQCLWGVTRRMWFDRQNARPDLATACRERIIPDPQFLFYVATYKRRSRPKVLDQVARAAGVRFLPPAQSLRGRRVSQRSRSVWLDQLKVRAVSMPPSVARVAKRAA